ncbi:unnamed protein product [Absidia cylindrospora]
MPVLECEFYHPCHSLILDLSDNHWLDVFTEDEMTELTESGKPMLRSLPQELVNQLDNLARLDGALDAYKFAKALDYDPITEPLMMWLAHTIMTTAHFFFPKDSSSMCTSLETDQLYQLWGFVNNIFHGTNIHALSKERSSTSNAISLNSKRRLSATEEMTNANMGLKMDTIYARGRIPSSSKLSSSSTSKKSRK